ncbi:ORF6C domain-containing protein [Clostridium neonatale]|uniref:ORF6C domain-containing protein n=1 Tax=Clostridium neonatale TaxID=137838 RepID=UPI00291B4BBA|nr:ORF6C domain-containing protein [Clostridium neonatale]CAI3208566.1 Bro-N domain-containing protein [Clostridium neonatale]CAI3212859.1 Bro-N domain-containing protein [Clostridium neonatale]
MSKEMQIFKNEKLSLQMRTIQNEDGSICVNTEDTAKGFGWIQNKNGKEYVRWETINAFLNEFGFSQEVGKDDYIPESIFYMLGMKASNKAAKEFQKWLAVDVIPSIRRTGGYNQPKKLSAMDQLKLQYEVLEEHEERFTKIENQLESLEVNPSQKKAIQKEKHKRVTELLGGNKSDAYKNTSFRSRVYAELGREYKNYFDISGYEYTPKNKFKEALEVVRSYNLSTELNMELKKINNQVSFEEAM